MDRQKKLLIFGVAWVSAGLLTWFLYANAVAPQQEKTLRVVVASRDMPLGTLLRESDLKLVNYPGADVPKGVLFQTQGRREPRARDADQQQRAGAALEALRQTSVEGVSSTIDPGYRAVSVQITDVSGVAGLIQPDSRVDVLFTRPGSMAEATTSTILQNVKVLSTGRTVAVGTDAGSARAEIARGHPDPAARRRAEAGAGEEPGQDQSLAAQSAGQHRRPPTPSPSPPKCSTP